jgi:hypothetical protein
MARTKRAVPPGEVFVLEVLAGAYRGGRTSLKSTLTHAASEHGNVLIPWCPIPADSLVDTGAHLKGTAPTCPKCLRLWNKAKS